MTDDILKSYSHAMVMDEETGKPMLKVGISGSTGGGDVTFPNDFPDQESILNLEELNSKLSSLESDIATIKNSINMLNTNLSKIVSGEAVVTVEIINEPEPEPDPEGDGE